MTFEGLIRRPATVGYEVQLTFFGDLRVLLTQATRSIVTFVSELLRSCRFQLCLYLFKDLLINDNFTPHRNY
ncbi:hypothetical protein D3C80_877520 [compost metagenome]